MCDHSASKGKKRNEEQCGCKNSSKNTPMNQQNPYEQGQGPWSQAPFGPWMQNRPWFQRGLSWTQQGPPGHWFQQGPPGVWSQQGPPNPWAQPPPGAWSQGPDSRTNRDGPWPRGPDTWSWNSQNGPAPWVYNNPPQWNYNGGLWNSQRPPFPGMYPNGYGSPSPQYFKPPEPWNDSASCSNCSKCASNDDEADPEIDEEPQGSKEAQETSIKHYLSELWKFFQHWLPAKPEESEKQRSERTNFGVWLLRAFIWALFKYTGRDMINKKNYEYFHRPNSSNGEEGKG